MADFEKAHGFTAKWEGGISDDPNDAGGYTAYGVCTAFLNDLYNSKSGRAFLAGLNIRGPITRAVMKRIDRDKAAAIFKYYFWDGQELGALSSQALALAWYDMSVNHGRAGGTRMIQQALNNMMAAGLVVDGIRGPKTMAQAHKASGNPGRIAALEAVRIREAFYRNLAARKPSQKAFLKGWLNRAADLKTYINKA